MLPTLCAGGLSAAPVPGPPAAAKTGATAELELVVQEADGEVCVAINGQVYRVSDLAAVPELAFAATLPYVVVYADTHARWSSVAQVLQALSNLGCSNLKIKKFDSRNKSLPVQSQD